MKSHLLFSIIFLVSMSCFSLCLARDYPRVLTMHEAFLTAIKKNPIIEQARSAKGKALEDLHISVSAFFPRLDLETSYIRSNNPVTSFSSKLNQGDFKPDDFDLNNLNHPDFLNQWGTKLVLTQPVFNRGKEYIGYKTASLKQKITDLSMKNISQMVLYMVEQAYYTVILAEKNIHVIKGVLNTAVEHERLALNRYREGLVLKSDLLSAKVQRASAEKRLYRARSDFRIAMATLNKVMGIDQDTPWKLQHADPSLIREGEFRLWIERALRLRPDLSMVKRELNIAEYNHEKAILNYLPAINLKGIYQKDRKDLFDKGSDSWTLMATMSINIFNSFADKASLSGARFEVNRKKAKLRSVKENIELEVRKAYYRLKTAKKQLNVARKSAREALESQHILKKRYENGLALMVELLSADTAVLKTSLDVERSTYDLFIAWAGLKWKSGVIGREILDKKFH